MLRDPLGRWAIDQEVFAFPGTQIADATAPLFGSLGEAQAIKKHLEQRIGINGHFERLDCGSYTHENKMARNSPESKAASDALVWLLSLLVRIVLKRIRPRAGSAWPRQFLLSPVPQRDGASLQLCEPVGRPCRRLRRGRVHGSAAASGGRLRRQRLE